MTSVVLASSSNIRQTLLSQAGVSFETRPAHVDEDMIKASLKQENAPVIEAATVLAEMKACKVSRAHPGVLVIGADQILDLNGDWFDKPVDVDQAVENLKRLRGQTHTLATSCVIAKDGQRIWHYADEPRLTMRHFSDGFLQDYVKKNGADVLASVGAYQLESEGIQLFAKVDGDYFTILGLPLLPLLDFLRTHTVLAS